MTQTTTPESAPGLADGHRGGQVTTAPVESGHNLKNHGGLPDSDNMHKFSTDSPNDLHKYTVHKSGKYFVR